MGNIQQPLRWGWLYLTALLSALSHLLLDWTNNYGLRPFLSIQFTLVRGQLRLHCRAGSAGCAHARVGHAWIFGLADSEMGAKKVKFCGRGWAIFALTAMVLLWGWRRAEQGRARMLLENAPINPAPVKRVGLEPYPINPFRWHAIVETPEFYQTAEINTLSGEITSNPHSILYKPSTTPATEAAKRTLLGQVYMDSGARGPWCAILVPSTGSAPW